MYFNFRELSRLIPPSIPPEREEELTSAHWWAVMEDLTAVAVPPQEQQPEAPEPHLNTRFQRGLQAAALRRLRAVDLAAVAVPLPLMQQMGIPEPPPQEQQPEVPEPPPNGTVQRGLQAAALRRLRAVHQAALADSPVRPVGIPEPPPPPQEQQPAAPQRPRFDVDMPVDYRAGAGDSVHTVILRPVHPNGPRGDGAELGAERGQ